MPDATPATAQQPGIVPSVGPASSEDNTVVDHRSKELLSPEKLTRALDHRIMPILFLAFVFFFLDKANIAFARIHGLEEDLDLGQYEFNIALVVFFVPNFILNIPGNLLLRHVGGGRWLSGLILAWGIVTLSTAFIKDKSGLYVTRIFLGIAESSFLGGALIYVGFFYNQSELISRVGLLYAASPLAGFLGGLLAGGLSRISNPVNGFGSWPWIFLAEGAATIALGAFAFALLPNTPADFMRWKGMAVTTERQTTPVASVEDKSVAKDITLHRHPDDQLSWKLCKRAIFNPMTMIMAAGAFFSIEGIYSYALFLPTIVHTMGFRALTASLMTAPPNFVGFIGTVLICKTSRKTGRTGKYLLGCAVTSLVGFVLLLVGGRIGFPGQTRTVAVQYTGTFFVSLGVHSLAPLALTWIHINMAPHYVRAIALGFVFTIGNLAPFVASFTYIRSEAPSYTRGHAINVGCLFGLVVIGVLTPRWMQKENARRANGERNYRMDQERWVGRRREEYELELGCLHPDFRYKI